MGIVNSIIVKLYDYENNFLKEYELQEPSDELFNIFHIPESSIVPLTAYLSVEELEDLKINYDKISNSVLEGYAEYKEKIDDALPVYKKWNIFKSRLAKSMRQYLKDNPVKDDNIVEGYFWLMFTTGSILAYISVAKEQKFKVEIVFREG